METKEGKKQYAAWKAPLAVVGEYHELLVFLSQLACLRAKSFFSPASLTT